MPLGECMERHTYRQLLVWLAWLENQWNEPDRHDYYLMQIAAAICSVNAKRGRRPKLKDFALKFRVGRNTSSASKEQAAAVSKAIWAARLRMLGKPPGSNHG